MKSLLEAKHLSVGYAKKEVLSDISFTLYEGELCAILGANGCGKTTLFRGIMGADAWIKGQCMVDNENILLMAPKKRAKEVALLPQKLEVPSGMLVKDIIEMGFYPRLTLLGNPTKEMENEMKTVMESVGIISLLENYYQELSEGQKQLVLLVRTLIQNTPIIFMDEPDSALDFTNKHQMFFRLKDLVRQQKKSGLLVLHDPSIALTYCNRIYLMKEGRLIEEIKPDIETVEVIREKLQLLYGNIFIQKNKKFIQVWYEEMSS